MGENCNIVFYVLYQICNSLHFNGVCPNYLRKTDITPAYKKKEKYLKVSYIPLSFVPSVSAIFKRRMFDQIRDYFETFFEFLCRFKTGYNVQYCMLLQLLLESYLLVYQMLMDALIMNS